MGGEQLVRQGAGDNCPPTAITSLNNTKSTITTAIDGLVAKGNTVIPAGLLWGWRVVSPGEPFSEGGSYTDEKILKAIVLLTDGENNVSGGGNYHNESTYNAFGFAPSGHLGNVSGSNAESTLNSKLTTVCNAVKAKDILVYTIGFQIDELDDAEPPEKLREQDQHVLQLAEQLTARSHLSGYRAGLKRAAHRAVVGLMI